jgi:outer membrane biosynthesis protein TonB
MNAPALTREEGLGLALAALGHAALVWVLVTAKPPEPLPPVERISVTLSDEVGAVSTSPDPTANPAPDKGPELGEPAPEPERVVAVQPEPAPQPKAAAVPPPRPTPAAKTPPKPPQQAQKTPTKWPFAPPQQATKTPAKTPPAKGGASVLDPNFGKGITGGTGKGKTPAASKASAQVVASWQNSISLKVRGPWQRCPVDGLDVEKLIVVVTFSLRQDGGIASIDDVRVSGQTPSNQAQVRPFKDCAVRAIKLAAPYTFLRPEFYDQWKVRELTFSKGKTR